VKAPEAARSLGLWIATAFRAAPGPTVLLALSVTIQALAAPAQSFGLSRLLDGIVGHHPGSVDLGAGLIVGALLVMAAVNSFSTLLEAEMYDRLHGYVHRDLLAVTSSVPGIEHHEDPRAADRMTQLREDTSDIAHSSLYLMNMVAGVVGTVSVLGLLATVHPLLLLLPLVGIARVWAATLAGNLLRDAVERNSSKIRLLERLAAIAAAPGFGMETRVFGMRPFLIGRMRETVDTAATDLGGALRRGVRYEVLVRLLFGLLYGGAIAFIVFQVQGGSTTPGQVALVITLSPAVERTSSLMAVTAFTISNMTRVFGGYRWLRDYAAEAVRAEGGGAAPSRLKQGISLHGAGFRYPEAEREALSDITLDLPAGTTVALVGENGAGKSTLVKLLARLYRPTSGRIDIDGTDLITIDPDAWRSRVSAGFQDFVRFEFTAGEAIGVGDLPHITDEPAVRAAAERGDASAVLAKLPDGPAQRLGKRFTDGTELSGGQWQRLALARAFMREEPLLLLLDEPTAALDPEAEHTLFESFAAASRQAATRTGGITVLVSHRFSTVRMADLVVVMDAGRIIETGTHEALLAADGRYAELFNLQARAYR
jgi:ATP-binding cassette subfamily B protein